MILAQMSLKMKYHVHIVVIIILIIGRFQEIVEASQRSLRVGEESKGRGKVKGLMG